MSKEKAIKHREGAHTFVLKPIPPALLTDALSEEGKPSAPLQKVMFVGGVEVEQPDENDEAYVRELGLWGAAYQARLLRLCLIFGVERVDGPEPTAHELAGLRVVYGSVSDEELQTLWRLSILRNPQGFLNLCLGQTHITSEGMANAEAKFRGNHQRAGISRQDHAVSAQSALADVDTE